MDEKANPRTPRFAGLTRGHRVALLLAVVLIAGSVALDLSRGAGAWVALEDSLTVAGFLVFVGLVAAFIDKVVANLRPRIGR
jgi:general stress protein CsbA